MQHLNYHILTKIFETLVTFQYMSNCRMESLLVVKLADLVSAVIW
jgi:hypothetical protein